MGRRERREKRQFYRLYRATRERNFEKGLTDDIFPRYYAPLERLVGASLRQIGLVLEEEVDIERLEKRFRAFDYDCEGKELHPEYVAWMGLQKAYAALKLRRLNGQPASEGNQ